MNYPIFPDLGMPLAFEPKTRNFYNGKATCKVKDR